MVECSAKDDHNIKDIFKTLLSVSKYSAPASNENSQTGLKRRSSAYVSASSSRSEYILCIFCINNEMCPFSSFTRVFHFFLSFFFVKYKLQIYVYKCEFGPFVPNRSCSGFLLKLGYYGTFLHQYLG